MTPEGLAVDFFGNVFVADPGRTEKVLKVVGSTETQVGHGFGNVHDIAVDQVETCGLRIRTTMR